MTKNQPSSTPVAALPDSEWDSLRAVFAERSTFTPEYQTFLRHLREARHKAGLTQVEVGQRLGVAQAIISKCERGERRLDVVELRAYCAALGVSYLIFLAELESSLSPGTHTE